jgi:hypothetical protein
VNQEPFVTRLLLEIMDPLRQWRGVERLRLCLERWVRGSLLRCHDMAFAQAFAENCPAPGARPADYLNRIVPVPGGRVLAGIRFHGGDLEQPFVDILAWDHDLLTPAAWRAMAHIVRTEFALFRPLRLRIILAQGQVPPVAPSHRTPDLLLIAGRLVELREQAAAVPSLAMTTGRATTLDFFPDYERAMTSFRAGAGALAREIEPTAAGDFQRCIDDGAVVVMHQGGTWAGVAAAISASEWALDGYLILAELLDVPFRGHGLGPCLQYQLIQALDPASDPLLFGTIHYLNAPSLATARRCGRSVVATYWFTAFDS